MGTKMLVVTNRRLEDAQAKDESMFGELPNDKGPGEVRLAWAERDDKGWRVTLVEEPDPLHHDNLPSRHVFADFKQRLVDARRNCVFYVHGYSKTFEESLEQGWGLQLRYDVGVLCFSWASNPGGIPPFDYGWAVAIARQSSPALDLTLEKLARYMRAAVDDDDCGISLNLLVHSLGNYLFQAFVEKPLFTGETRIFDNLVLHQPDVDSAGHERWVDRLRYARRVYVTINERDKVLDISDVRNPDRLGNTASGLVAARALYLGFTGADEVGKRHQLWNKPADGNPIVKGFFDSALNGAAGEGEPGIEYNPQKNAYEVS